MPVSVRILDHILVNILGFERRMGRHQIYVLRIGEKQVARTLISHGVREISDSLLSLIARQMRITPVQLKKIISGELGRTDYYHLLGIGDVNDE
ncbi:MAG: hypothetical protein AB7S75_14055 [Desulfococcaceae bacterium]